MYIHLLRSNENVSPVVWIDDFLSDNEIKKIIKYVEKQSFESGQIGGSSENIKNKFSIGYNDKSPINKKIRTTKVKWIIPGNETEWLYNKLTKQVHKVNVENFDFILKYIESLQFSEYTSDRKEFYSKHNDCGEKSNINNFLDVRKLSFSIQLTNEHEYEGGDLIFHYNEKDNISITAPKNRGTIIFFESNIIHEVTPVTKGTRHSLVGWVSGPCLR